MHRFRSLRVVHAYIKRKDGHDRAWWADLPYEIEILGRIVVVGRQRRNFDGGILKPLLERQAKSTHSVDRTCRANVKVSTACSSHGGLCAGAAHAPARLISRPGNEKGIVPAAQKTPVVGLMQCITQHRPSSTLGDRSLLLSRSVRYGTKMGS